ncbi:hypothetical protein F7725_007043, partial [Dissostichus mawsoni]
MLSLLRYPPQPELIDSISDLPSPKYYQLHPYFFWKPEHAIMERVRNNFVLPCLYGCPNPQVASSGIGRPRVILGTSGQCYILASRLTCKVCKEYWQADKPQWLENNIVPAFLTHKKAVCKSVLDEMRRSSRSPEDMSKKLTEALNLKYERAHLAYLLMSGMLRHESTARKPSLGTSEKADNQAPFGRNSDADGRCGVSHSSHSPQEELITLLLQGSFGQALRSDHTRVARKVVLSSGGMSSHVKMNENWMTLSWVMCPESDVTPSLWKLKS